jgi:hypothetical protein
MPDEPEITPSEETAEQPASADVADIEQILPGLYIVKNSPAPVWDTDYFAPPKWIPRIKKDERAG